MAPRRSDTRLPCAAGPPADPGSVRVRTGFGRIAVPCAGGAGFGFCAERGARVFARQPPAPRSSRGTQLKILFNSARYNSGISALCLCLVSDSQAPLSGHQQSGSQPQAAQTYHRSRVAGPSALPRTVRGSAARRDGLAWLAGRVPQTQSCLSGVSRASRHYPWRLLAASRASR